MTGVFLNNEGHLEVSSHDVTQNLTSGQKLRSRERESDPFTSPIKSPDKVNPLNNDEHHDRITNAFHNPIYRPALMNFIRPSLERFLNPLNMKLEIFTSGC